MALQTLFRNSAMTDSSSKRGEVPGNSGGDSPRNVKKEEQLPSPKAKEKEKEVDNAARMVADHQAPKLHIVGKLTICLAEESLPARVSRRNSRVQ